MIIAAKKTFYASLTAQLLLWGMLFSGTSALSGKNSISHSWLNKRGLYYLGKKDFKKAGRYFLRAIKKKPGNRYYYNNYAVTLMNQGKYKEAKSYLKIAVTLDPNYVKALSNMAIVCFRLYQFREAHRYYSRARSVNSAYIDRRFDRKKTIREVEKLSREDPDNSDLQYILDYLKK